ncbi:MAG: glycosyltransferase family 2 protein [Blautia sp.]|nr:glycosyltransferase family 2 protein [Blautia sp.]
MKEISVDVLIPVYHPGKEFHELLVRLNRQKMPVRKIWIMNTEKEFWNPDWEREFPELEVRHLTKKEFDHGGTRRSWAALSDADFLICMTQDALPADTLLVSGLLAPLLADPQIGSAYARQMAKKGSGLLEALTRSFNYPAESVVKWEKDLPVYGVKTFFCSNVCAVYRKSVYDELGGFPERAIFNEDMIFARRVIDHGYGICYAADARVYHSHRYSCRQQFQRNFDLGVSQAEHPEVFADVPSEGEGIALVKKTAVRLVEQRHPELLPQLFFQSASKYLGYLAGKHYRALPKSWIARFTMNPSYWSC